jgi:ABC-type multidrug transport system fused ATPase/permease subunit
MLFECGKDELAFGLRLQRLQAAGSSSRIGNPIAVFTCDLRRNVGSLQQEQKVRRLAAGLTFRVDAILAVTVALAVGLGMQAILAGRLTAGDLVLFVSYAMSLRSPFTDFARQTARLGRTYACAERLAKIAELAPSIVTVPRSSRPRRAALAFESVSPKRPRRGGRK